MTRFHFLFAPGSGAVKFALRTTLTALLALALAAALHLEDPHWAAMTVWVVAQPTRGMVLSKGLYRLAGTVLGSAAAAFMVAAFGHAVLPLSLALAVWIALCAAAAPMLPGFRAYGAVLAGYSAAMVAIISLGQSDALHVALIRVASVALGIVVSGVITLVLLPGSTARDLLIRARVASRHTLAWAAHCAEHGHDAESVARQHGLLAELAQIHAQGDLAAAGSANLSGRLRHARGLIAALLTLMAQIRTLPRLPELAAALRTTNSATDAHAAFAAWPGLAATVAELLAQNRALARQTAAPAPPPLGAPDWKAARLAAGRAFLAVAATGLLWAVTGWRDGPVMLMAAAIMGSVFAATDTPHRNVLQAMKGSTLAVAAALAVHHLLPAHAPITLAMAVAAPFMVLGGLAMAHRPTLIPGTDFNMAFLLLSQPGAPAHADVAALLNMALGIICGMAAAALFNRLGAPNEEERLAALLHEIEVDLRRMAGAKPERAARWRAKAFHRVLRMVLRSPDSGMLERAMAALAVGLELERLHDHRPEMLAAFAQGAAPERVAEMAAGEPALADALRRFAGSDGRGP